MKKLLLSLAVIVAVATAASARDTYSRSVADLPAPAVSFLKNTFKAKVSLIKIDSNLLGHKDYEVILMDGTEVSFDKAGNWTEIETSASASVPSSLYPAGVTQYVRKMHKGAKIVGLEKSGSGFDVELTGGLELKFDSKGNFLRYDD